MIRFSSKVALIITSNNPILKIPIISSKIKSGWLTMLIIVLVYKMATPIIIIVVIPIIILFEIKRLFFWF